MKFPPIHICTVAALLLMVTLLPAGCTDDDLIDPAAGQYTDRVCFSTTTPAFEPDTRSGAPADCFVLRPEAGGRDSLFVNASVCAFDAPAAPATRAPLTTSATLKSFVVSAFAKDNGVWTTFFTDEENTREAEGAPWIYTSGRTHYWPGAEHPMRFCAHSPSKATGLEVNHSMVNGVPYTLTFSVSRNIQQQVDLLAANAEEVPGDYNSVYPLAFNHVCTAVQFREGADMQPGTLKKIELIGVYKGGTYSFESNSWTLDTSFTTDFTQTLNDPDGKDMTQQEGADITNDTDCFIMMPQTLPEGAQLRITFRDKVTDTDRTMTASLAGKQWPQGKKVVYTISITPDYKFGFTDAPASIDAHYDIVYKTLRVTGVPDGKAWTLKASLSAYSPDGETPSIQLQSQMHQYAQMGYWLDRRVNADGSDAGSARGETTLKGTGSGDFPIAIFVPENMSGATRDVVLEASFDGTNAPGTPLTAQRLTLQQFSPAPAPGGSFGWEQIDDNEQGEFGFCWNARYMYLIPYDSSNDVQTKAHELSETLIDKYQASAFVYNQNIDMRREGWLSVPTPRNTWATIIDYSRLSVTSTTYSDYDGLANTQSIIDIGRGAFSKLFQNALLNLTKANAGETDNTAGDILFRPPSDWEIDNRTNSRLTFENWETKHEGSPSGLFVLRYDGSQLLEPGASIWSYLGTRNSYNLTQSTTVTGAYVWTPTLKELKWYLPAKDQFNSLPATVSTPITPSGCWSSTPVKDGTNAYVGSGASEPRPNKHKVRACRNLTAVTAAPRRR